LLLREGLLNTEGQQTRLDTAGARGDHRETLAVAVLDENCNKYTIGIS
jgi:hypothetical protein